MVPEPSANVAPARPAVDSPLGWSRTGGPAIRREPSPNLKRPPPRELDKSLTAVGERELRTQRRVVRFFRYVLGYDYLGHWQDRPGNRNVEKSLLGEWLGRQGPPMLVDSD